MGSPLSLAGQEVGVRAAVEKILEGMRTADSEMVRGVFASEARFAIIDRRAASAVTRGQHITTRLPACVTVLRPLSRRETSRIASR